MNIVNLYALLGLKLSSLFDHLSCEIFVVPSAEVFCADEMYNGA